MAEEATNGETTGSSAEHRPRPRPRLLGLRRIPRLGAILERAPHPAAVERGSPQASADEDIRILDELAGLRRDANCDLA
ncbi:MAG: hypothetical protein H0U10_04145 [Chloroflexia bacterium]|nr:hypothetical protein [Chloroflexia bacterium]